MLQQNFTAQQHQNHAAGQLRPAFALFAHDAPGSHADGRQDKGGYTDKTDGGDDIHLQKGEGNAHGQGVNAGGDGQREHGFTGEIGLHTLLVVLSGLPDHIDADDGQQHKGDPMVHVGDKRLKADAQQPAQKGHQRLEAAEPQSGDEGMAQPHLTGGKALADRDGKGIHGQSHGDQKQFDDSHMYLPKQQKKTKSAQGELVSSLKAWPEGIPQSVDHATQSSRRLLPKFCCIPYHDSRGLVNANLWKKTVAFSAGICYTI